jgi:integrase
MTDQPEAGPERKTADTGPARRSTKKKDAAPRGVFRHRSGVWAVRFTCGAGHIHQEKVGPLKSDTVRVYHERRARALHEAGWCPAVERQRERERVRLEAQRERRRVTFREYAEDYLRWARVQHRSFDTTESQVKTLMAAFGHRKLDEISTADVERLLAQRQEQVAAATCNRYRDRLSGMFKRARRLGLVTVNPVSGIPKLKEPGGRLLWLNQEEERAIGEALPPELRPLFTVSVHTGLRWSEQVGLRWRDVDVLTGFLTVRLSKNGRARQVPMNAVVRSVLLDLAAQRQRPDDPEEPVFRCRYTQADKFFPRAVAMAQATLKKAGKDASRLDGYTWHGNRHTFASRLIMAGVDPRTVQELGGWRSLTMVQRYAHLAPEHLRAAVERLARQEPEEELRGGAVELGQNLGRARARTHSVS